MTSCYKSKFLIGPDHAPHPCHIIESNPQTFVAKIPILLAVHDWIAPVVLERPFCPRLAGISCLKEPG